MLGKNLITALVPLRDSLNVGSAINTNFNNSDFSQSLGLTGNGSSKILNSKVSGSHLGTSNNGGIGYWELNTPPTTDGEQMGLYSVNPQFRYGFYLRSSPARRIFWWGDANNRCGDQDGVGAAAGHYYGQRSSITSRKLYLDATNIGSNNTTSDTPSGIDDTTLRIVGTHYLTNYPCTSRCGASYMTDGTMTDDEIRDFHSLLGYYLVWNTGKATAPTPTPTPTPTITATITPTPTITISPTPTITISPTATITPTATLAYPAYANYDEFEQYPTASISLLVSGSGWADFGSVYTYSNPLGYDNFEEYPTESISLLDSGSGWQDTGSIYTYTFSASFDAFEQYATGSITYLNSGSWWQTTGSIITY
jgi:hypothetical protein